MCSTWDFVCRVLVLTNNHSSPSENPDRGSHAGAVTQFMKNASDFHTHCPPEFHLFERHCGNASAQFETPLEVPRTKSNHVFMSHAGFKCSSRLFPNNNLQMDTPDINYPDDAIHLSCSCKLWPPAFLRCSPQFPSTPNLSNKMRRSQRGLVNISDSIPFMFNELLRLKSWKVLYILSSSRPTAISLSSATGGGGDDVSTANVHMSASGVLGLFPVITSQYSLAGISLHRHLKSIFRTFNLKYLNAIRIKLPLVNNFNVLRFGNVDWRCRSSSGDCPTQP